MKVLEESIDDNVHDFGDGQRSFKCVMKVRKQNVKI